MKPQITRLSGSAELISLRTDKFKKNILIMTRVLDISPTTTPLDALLPSVLIRGTEKYPKAVDFARRCEELYGVVFDYYYSYFGDKLMVNIIADFLDDRVVDEDASILLGVTELMAQVWLHPRLEQNGLLPADEVEKAKGALIDSIRATLNDTAAYASKRTRELMCEGEPAGYSIGVEDVQSITPERLTERYFELRRTDEVSFFYVGGADVEKLASALDSQFGDSLSACCPIKLSFPKHERETVRVDETMPVTQSKLDIGLYSGARGIFDDDYYANLLAVEILGGSATSKLFLNVRERLGLCYYCNATYNGLRGIVTISSGIAAEDREKVEREIEAQIEAMRRGDISDEELDVAHLACLNACRRISDRPYSIWNFFSTRHLLEAPESVEYHTERLLAVTREQIVDAVRKWRTGAVFFINATGDEEENYED